ncbi:unnamed protein product, partial [Mesorhabditis belari]|uniref:Uncharacterized protein n=1 Tax=Mesorhabditis belari TaxID=2138241 RepID=A0AAF3F772_9BILA
MPQFHCPYQMVFWLAQINSFYIVRYGLSDMSQYCQFCISLSRFFALAFDGAYFRYSMRLPYLQVLIPYALRFAIGYLGELCEKQLYDGWMYFYDPFVVYAPYFLTCAFDFVIRRKMKKLKHSGHASRAEMLLMTQMIISSLVTFTYTIGFYFVGNVSNLFFNWDVANMLMSVRDFSHAFLFNLVLSIITALFLRKPKEKPARTRNSITVTVHPSKGH